jgi:AraC-like DNA-binding protein
MQSPITIHYPPELTGNLEISHSRPSEHVIPFAQYTSVTCKLGDFIIQSVNGDDYWIELWSFAVREQGYLDIIANRPSICISLFLKGDLSGYLLGHRRATALANTYNIFYLPEGKHKINLETEEYVLLYIVLPENYLKGMMKEHPRIQEIVSRFLTGNKKSALLSGLALPKTIWRMLKRMERTGQKGSALDFTLRQHILEIIASYNDQFRLNNPDSSVYLTAREKALAVRDIILANPGDNSLGGLTELSVLFHISSKTLNKHFKRLTGKTVPGFIRDERLEWARGLLNEGKKQVSEVAEMIGYSDTANFIRSFKKKYGHSPGKQNPLPKKK